MKQFTALDETNFYGGPATVQKKKKKLELFLTRNFPAVFAN